jgi:hypothetical protein
MSKHRSGAEIIEQDKTSVERQLVTTSFFEFRLATVGAFTLMISRGYEQPSGIWPMCSPPFKKN